MHHHTELSFVDEFSWVSPLHCLKNGWQNVVLRWCTLEVGPPSLHYYCVVVLHSCILLPSVGHSSNHEYHCRQLTRKLSGVSNLYCTFKVLIWLSLVYIYIYIYIYIHRMSKEERSIFWEIIVSVILSKKLYMNMCPIPNGFRDRAIWLYSGLAWAPSIVLPSRPAPLSEACEFSNFRKFIINCTNSVTWTINTGIRNSTYS